MYLFLQKKWLYFEFFLVDSVLSIGGELVIGYNIIVVYMLWEGYNYEDVILINECLVYEDIYILIYIE